MTNSKFYEASTDVNYIRLGVALFLSLLLSCCLGYLYSLFTYLVPLIYLSVLLAIGFGIVLHWSIRLIIRLSKIQSKTSRTILIIGTIFFSTYFAWVAFLSSAALGIYQTPFNYLTFLDWIFHPQDLFNLIYEVNKIGTWSIGVNGGPVNGSLLAIVWGLEFIAIAFSSLQLISSYPIFPFSENYNKWYTKFTLEDDFESLSSSSATITKLDTGVLETLQNLDWGNGFNHSKIHLYYLEQETDQYLSIEKVMVTDRKKGTITKTPVVVNYRINNSDAKAIKNTFRITKERFDVL